MLLAWPNSGLHAVHGNVACHVHVYVRLGFRQLPSSGEFFGRILQMQLSLKHFGGM